MNSAADDRTKVLYISAYIEHPSVGGPQLRAETSIKALSQVCELHVCQSGNCTPRTNQETKLFFSNLCHRWVTLPSIEEVRKFDRFPLLWSLARQVRGIVRGNASSLSKDATFMINYIQQQGITILWFGHATGGLYELMKAIRQLNPRLSIVCDTDSVWSQFIQRGLHYVRSELERSQIEREAAEKEAEERDWIKCSRVVTAVSDDDRQYYWRLSARKGQIHSFSNVIDPTTYQDVPPPARGLRKPCLYLAGSFYGSHSPMEDGTRWLLGTILPLVRRQIPDVHLYIVGRGSDSVLSDINDLGVTVTGQLPSVLSYLCHADVSLVPLRFESGTRFKILEAGACGVPVVSTTLGAEGLPVVHGKDILIADQPDSIADAIVRLITDRKLASELGRNLRNLVLEQYSIARLVKEGSKILEYLRQGSTVQAPV